MQDLRGGGLNVIFFFFKAPGLLCLLVGLHYFAQNYVIIYQCYNNNTNDI